MSSGSESNGGGGGGGSGGEGGVSASSRKMIRRMKEILPAECLEEEIYAMLRECGMDPNEAVQRLLAEDTFHEVKRRRERRKEMKKNQQSRSRVGPSGSNHVSGGVTSEHNGQYSSTSQTNCCEHEKSTSKRGSGSLASPMPAYVSSSSSSQMAATTIIQEPIFHRDLTNFGDKLWSRQAADAMSSSAHTSTGFQAPWLGLPGYSSMADIVKMNRPSGKGSCSGIMMNASSLSHDRSALDQPNHQLKQPHDSYSMLLETNGDLYTRASSYGTAENIDKHNFIGGSSAKEDEWPMSEQPTAALGAERHLDLSDLHTARDNMSWSNRLDSVRVSEVDIATRNFDIKGNTVKSSSAASRQTIGSSARVTSYCHGHELEPPKDCCAPLANNITATLSSTTENLQWLRLEKEKPVESCLEDKPAPLIPSHLQVSSADLSHLSFGSYKPRNAFTISRSPSSNATEPGSMNASGLRNGSSVSHLGTRSLSYRGEELHRSNPEARKLSIDARTCNEYMPSPLQLAERVSLVSSDEHHSICETSVPANEFETKQYRGSSLSNSQENTRFEDFPLCSTIPACPKRLPSDSLATSVQPFSESVPYSSSSLLLRQLMQSRQRNALTNSTATFSVAEIAPVSNPSLQKLHNVGIARAFPEHLTASSYAQASPLGHLSTIMGDTFVRDTSTFQQAYPFRSAFDQSQAAAQDSGISFQQQSIPSQSSLLSLASNGSDYGSYGYSSRDFIQNPLAVSARNSFFDGNFPSSHCNGRNQFISPLNESFATWHDRLGSQSESVIPNTELDGIEGHNPQHDMFQETQLPWQHNEAVQYSNFRHPQSGLVQERFRSSRNDLTSAHSEASSTVRLHKDWRHS